MLICTAADITCQKLEPVNSNEDLRFFSPVVSALKFRLFICR